MGFPVKKQIKAVVTLLETLAFLGCIAAVDSGIIDKWLTGVPFLAYALTAAAVVLLAIIILTSIRPAPLFKRRRILLALSFATVGSVHLTTQDFPAYTAAFTYPHSSFYFLYYACILIYAVCGSGPQFFSMLALCIFGESVNCASHGYFSGLSAAMSSHSLGFFADRGVKLLPPLGYMLGAGIVPYTLSAMRKLKDSAPQKRQIVSLSQQMGQNHPALDAALHDTRRLKNPGNTSVLIMRQDGDEGFIGNSNIENLLSSIVYFMSRNFKAYSALGFIYEPEAKSFVLNSYHSKSLSIVKDIRIPEGKGVVGALALDKQAFISGDLSYYSAELLYYHNREMINSVVAVPIISHAKDLLGALVIDSQENNAFKEDHKDIMKRFSLLAAALITNVRMRLFQERAAAQFQIFYEASQQFINALHLPQVFDVLVSMVEKLTPCTRIIAISFHENDKSGRIIKIKGASPDLQEGFQFKLNSGLYSYVLLKLKPVNIPDFQAIQEKYYRFSPEEPALAQLRSLLIIPIVDNQSKPSGLISIESDCANQFQGDLEKVLVTLVGNASVAITRAGLYHNMELLATTDGLTHLINHKHFQEQLAKELERTNRYKRPMALLLMDIDHFKSFNDTYGHPVGDLVLREIAQCIKQALRANDIAARYGGEEFTVIIPDNGPEGALATAERIRKRVEQKIIMSGENQLRVTISLGCASFPAQAATQQELIDNADKALYYSKETGRNRSTLYVKGMGKKD